MEEKAKQQRKNPARSAKLRERAERRQHTVKQCLGESVRNPALVEKIEEVAVAVGQARCEASLLLNLHLARCFAEAQESDEKFVDIQTYLNEVVNTTEFFRRLLFTVVELDRN